MKRIISNSIAILVISILGISFQSCERGNKSNEANEVQLELAKSISAALDKQLSDTSFQSENVAYRDSVISENIETVTETISDLAHSRNGFYSNLTPLFGIIFSIGGPIILVILICYFSFKDKRNKYRMIEHAIDKNYSPESFSHLIEEKNKKKEPSPKSGFVCTFVGIACLVSYFTIKENVTLGIGGLVALAVGIGLLLAYFVEQKNKNNNENKEN